MYIIPPEKIITWDEDHLRMMAQWQQSRMDFALQEIDNMPSEETLSEAVTYLAEEAGVCLTPEQLKTILSLYPAERGKLASYGWGDTEVEEMILDVIVNFLMGTRWPIGKDNVNIDTFLARVKSVASARGYEVS